MGCDADMIARFGRFGDMKIKKLFGEATGNPLQCNNRLNRHCKDEAQCDAWGAPYIHKTHYTHGLCWKGFGAAKCGQTPVDWHHQRLCPCLVDPHYNASAPSAPLPLPHYNASAPLPLPLQTTTPAPVFVPAPGSAPGCNCMNPENCLGEP